jgi:hypothetical protein
MIIPVNDVPQKQMIKHLYDHDLGEEKSSCVNKLNN